VATTTEKKEFDFYFFHFEVPRTTDNNQGSTTAEK
jgi:hypothetical protein